MTTFLGTGGLANREEVEREEGTDKELKEKREADDVDEEDADDGGATKIPTKPMITTRTTSKSCGKVVAQLLFWLSDRVEAGGFVVVGNS